MHGPGAMPGATPAAPVTTSKARRGAPRRPVIMTAIWTTSAPRVPPLRSYKNERVACRVTDRDGEFRRRRGRPSTGLDLSPESAVGRTCPVNGEVAVAARIGRALPLQKGLGLCSSSEGDNAAATEATAASKAARARGVKGRRSNGVCWAAPERRGVHAFATRRVLQKGLPLQGPPRPGAASSSFPKACDGGHCTTLKGVLAGQAAECVDGRRRPALAAGLELIRKTASARERELLGRFTRCNPRRPAMTRRGCK